MLRFSQFGQARGKSKNWEEPNMNCEKANSLLKSVWRINTQSGRPLNYNSQDLKPLDWLIIMLPLQPTWSQKWSLMSKIYNFETIATLILANDDIILETKWYWSKVTSVKQMCNLVC